MSHHHHHHHHTTDENIKDMKVAFWLNLAFTIIEFIGGILTNSFAIITDAFHDLGDSVALAMGIWLEKFSKKKPTVKYSYGYKRFSLLSACILSTILIVGSVIMAAKSVINFFSPTEVKSTGMVGLSILGILVNGFAFLRMYRNTNKNKMNSRTMMLHFLEDVLGWVAIFVGGIIIHFTHWYWVDSLLSLVIAVFILYNAVPNLISVFKIFLQSVPKEIDIASLEKELKLIDEIINLHNLFIWTEDGESHVATLHVIISQNDLVNSDKIRNTITKILNDKGIHNATIQLESNSCESK